MAGCRGRWRRGVLAAGPAGDRQTNAYACGAGRLHVPPDSQSASGGPARPPCLAPALALSTHSPLYLLRILYYLYLIFKSTSGKYIHFNLCDCVLIYVHFFTQCLFIYFFLNIILCYILCFILCKLNYSQKSSGIFVHLNTTTLYLFM